MPLKNPYTDTFFDCLAEYQAERSGLCRHVRPDFFLAADTGHPGNRMCVRSIHTAGMDLIGVGIMRPDGRCWPAYTFATN